MRPERTKATKNESDHKQAQQQRLFNSNHRRLAITTIAKFERWQTGCTRLLQQHLGTNRAIVFFPEQ